MDVWVAGALPGVLNAGHTRAIGFVLWAHGGAEGLRVYSTWSMQMLALIGRISGPMLFGEVVLAYAGLAVDESRLRCRQGPQQRRDVGGPLDPLGAHIG